jgi:alpha-ketoglutarate-dependent taurine dioxygenase
MINSESKPARFTPRRKTVVVAPSDLVEAAPLTPGRRLPLLIQPVMAGVDLAEWAAANRELVEAWLLEHRALLFRGFWVRTAAGLESLIAATSDGRLLEYRDRSSPRHAVADRIYTSTDYPPDQTILLHNEGTYWTTWPLKIYFCCATAPELGGATPIADTRGVYARLSAATRDRFAGRQALYQRNFNLGFGLTWQTVFQTDDRSAVEEYCRRNAIEYEWLDCDRLRTRQRRPAVAVHPRTGEAVWFNHAAFFHITSLDPVMRETLLSEFGPGNLPFNTYYGDGAEIEIEVLEELRAAYDAEKVRFDWQEGDALLLDNMTVAHGREPYCGERRVLVGMAEPHSRGENERIARGEANR